MSTNDDTMAAARFAAANLRAWADHVEATGDGLRVEPYSISVDTPLDRHIGMAPRASCGSVGWRHAPKLRHRNRGFGDHGDPWSDHHKHGVHEPLPDLDAPPAEPEPPCPRCTLALYICRCDEDDLREALRDRIDALNSYRGWARKQVKLRSELHKVLGTGKGETLLEAAQRVTALDPWCVAVGEPSTPRRGPKGKWFLSEPTCRHHRFFGTCSATWLVNLLSPGTPICCPKVRLRGRSVRRKSVDVTRRCIVDLFDDLTAAAENNAPCPRCDSLSGPYNGWGLAGGGFGSYAGCQACDAFIKIRVTDDSDDDAPAFDTARQIAEAREGFELLCASQNVMNPADPSLYPPKNWTFAELERLPFDELRALATDAKNQGRIPTPKAPNDAPEGA